MTVSCVSHTVNVLSLVSISKDSYSKPLLPSRLRCPSQTTGVLNLKSTLSSLSLSLKGSIDHAARWSMLQLPPPTVPA